MKKLIVVIGFLFSLSASSQNVDTVSVNLTLRAQDWAWAIGKFGSGNDSTSRARIRYIRDAIRTANPQNWTTNVPINNVNGLIVVWIYNQFMHAGFGEMMAMGTTNAERTTIYTAIRAIAHPSIQYHIGAIDATTTSNYTEIRNNGKQILIDN